MTRLMSLERVSERDHHCKSVTASFAMIPVSSREGVTHLNCTRCSVRMKRSNLPR